MKNLNLSQNEINTLILSVQTLREQLIDAKDLINLDTFNKRKDLLNNIETKLKQ